MLNLRSDGTPVVVKVSIVDNLVCGTIQTITAPAGLNLASLLGKVVALAKIKKNPGPQARRNGRRQGVTLIERIFRKHLGRKMTGDERIIFELEPETISTRSAASK